MLGFDGFDHAGLRLGILIAAFFPGAQMQLFTICGFQQLFKDIAQLGTHIVTGGDIAQC